MNIKAFGYIFIFLCLIISFIYLVKTEAKTNTKNVDLQLNQERKIIIDGKEYNNGILPLPHSNEIIVEPLPLPNGELSGLRPL